MKRPNTIGTDKTGRYSLELNKENNIIRVFDEEQNTCPGSVYVRVVCEEGYHYIGYRIMRDYKNKGLEVLMINYFIKHYKKIKIKVSKGDLYTISIFSSLGFKKEEVEEDKIIFSNRKRFFF